MTDFPMPPGRTTSSASDPSGRPPTRPSSKSIADPIVRNALRYSISTREYAALHRYIISRSRVLRRNAPAVSAVEKMIEGEKNQGKPPKGRTGAGVADPDYNARAVRHATRVFVATGALMKLWGIVARKLAGKEKEYD